MPLALCSDADHPLVKLQEAWRSLLGGEGKWTWMPLALCSDADHPLVKLQEAWRSVFAGGGRGREVDVDASCILQ